MKVIYDKKYFKHNKEGVFLKYPPPKKDVYILRFEDLDQMAPDMGEGTTAFVGYISGVRHHTEAFSKYISWESSPSPNGYRDCYVAGVAFSDCEISPIVEDSCNPLVRLARKQHLISRGICLEVSEGEVKESPSEYSLVLKKDEVLLKIS